MLEQVELHSPEGFSGVIFGEIARLLERHKVRLADVEAYATAAGLQARWVHDRQAGKVGPVESPIARQKPVGLQQRVRADEKVGH